MGNTPIEIEITGWTISTEELFPLASTIKLAAAGCVETLKLGSRRLPLELGSEATVETCYLEEIIRFGASKLGSAAIAETLSF